MFDCYFVFKMARYCLVHEDSDIIKKVAASNMPLTIKDHPF